MSDATRSPGASRVPVIEACCDSVATARAAQEAGATRIELCGPGDGGTTPSLGLLRQCRRAITIDLAVMVRPRAGDFVYDDQEIAVMLDDVATAREEGADVIVFGALNADDRLDAVRTRLLAERAGTVPVTMHRAFDRIADQSAALEELATIGVRAVLTSGGARDALAGVQRLADLTRQADGRVTIMAGGHIRAHNVREIVARSGVTAVHARALETETFREMVRSLRSDA